jgi:A/G-specific adenine glycosylase
MLQQTQAPRVVQKYTQFIQSFPTADVLAKAPLKKVLIAWQGLGYNRRALNLQKAAQQIMEKHRGKFPKDMESLLELPGVGPATAGDIMAFAFNKAETVIETNIRTVFIHHFFTDQKNIADKEIIPLIKKTLDRSNPREWYYALMDYGTMLKKSIPNPSRRSKHYAKQSAFRGSNRELRSKILKYTLMYGKQKPEIIAESLGADLSLVSKNIATMSKEGLI